MDVPAQRNTPPCALPSRYRLAPSASTVRAPNNLQGFDLYYFFPGISDGIAPGAGFVPPDPDPQPWPDCSIMTCTLPSASTRDTPVVMSTFRRSPLSTFLHWISTTPAAPPVIVMRLARVSKTAVSPVTTWSFCVTTTE